MIRSLPINNQRHRALRAVLARVVLSGASVPIAGIEAGRDNMFLVRGVDEAEESRWDNGHDVEFANIRRRSVKTRCTNALEVGNLTS